MQFPPVPSTTGNAAYSVPLTAKVAQAVDAAKVAAARAVPAVTEAALDQVMRNNPGLNPRPGSPTKLALDIDHNTGLVIGQIIDQDSGEVVRQIPTEDMLRLIAATKEFLGNLVDRKA
ncbi:MAG: flagellar protein FlaG [Rhodospirillales bacterium]